MVFSKYDFYFVLVLLTCIVRPFMNQRWRASISIVLRYRRNIQIVGSWWRGIDTDSWIRSYPMVPTQGVAEKLTVSVLLAALDYWSYYCYFSCSPPAAKCQFLTALFALKWMRAGLFVVPPLEDCLTGLSASGSSTQAGTGCTDLQLVGSSVTDCQALTWPNGHMPTCSNRRCFPRLEAEAGLPSSLSRLTGATGTGWVTSASSRFLQSWPRCLSFCFWAKSLHWGCSNH